MWVGLDQKICKALLYLSMERIKSIKIKAEVVFNDVANHSFKFPIRNPVRMSLWEKDRRYSTPSETSCDTPINLNLRTEVTVEFLSNYLDRAVIKGDKFFLGRFPVPIGDVIVLGIIYQP